VIEINKSLFHLTLHHFKALVAHDSVSSLLLVASSVTLLVPKLAPSRWVVPSSSQFLRSIFSCLDILQRAGSILFLRTELSHVLV
jgi:hypothetical protein